jgi:hypothetical protein
MDTGSMLQLAALRSSNAGLRGCDTI